MKKILYVLLALVPLLDACVYDFEAELSEDQYAVVVEGDIVVGGTSVIRFTRLNAPSKQNIDWGSFLSSSSSSWNPSASAGSDVRTFSATVEGEDGTTVTAMSSAGQCLLDTRNLSRSVRYRLCIHDDQTGEDYASDWEMPEGAPVIDSLSYKIVGSRMDLSVTFHSDGTTPYYNLTYDEEWEYHAYADSYYRYIPQGDPAPQGYRVYQVFPEDEQGFGDMYGRIFYVNEHYPTYTCWNSSRYSISTVVTTGAMVSDKLVDYVFRSIDREDMRLSVVYRPIVTVKMISRVAYEYWENMERVSEQTGDLFAPVPSSVRGNIVNVRNPEANVIGYIGVSTVATADRFIRNKDIEFYRQPAWLYDYLQQQSLGWGEAKGVKAPMMPAIYLVGYRPWRTDMGEYDLMPFYIWIPSSCLDCRTQGGGLHRPSDWPQFD